MSNDVLFRRGDHRDNDKSLAQDNPYREAGWAKLPGGRK